MDTPLAIASSSTPTTRMQVAARRDVAAASLCALLLAATAGASHAQALPQGMGAQTATWTSSAMPARWNGGTDMAMAPARLLQGGHATLGLPLNQRVALIYQPRVDRPATEILSAPGLADTVQDRPHIGLEFRRKSATQDMRSLLRVQLSGGSALHFRPRGGGLMVSYRAQF